MDGNDAGPAEVGLPRVSESDQSLALRLRCIVTPLQTWHDNMKAMILAAGLGTRLRPLTLERAKPAVPLLGTPLMIRLLETLMENTIHAFRINLHHLPHTIEQLFNVSPWDSIPVSFSHEPSILGTAGGLKDNEAFFDQGTFVMANGDILIDFSLADALAFHKDSDALATLILFPQSPPYQYYPMRIDENGKLVDFKGFGSARLPRSQTYVFTGIHILETEIFQYIPKGRFSSITDEAYVAAMKDGKNVCGFPVTGYWNDIGDPQRYLQVQRHLINGNKAGATAHPSRFAAVDATAHVGRFVSVGNGCQFDSGSSVENSILWDKVVIEEKSSIRNCIVGSGTIVSGHHSDMIISQHGVRSFA
jgi:NDP-sugar pyrophosphorylase family protein